ncbi:hypothetical protein H2203_000836 [Taxawa tesnikishii (nom. ined.)]|nr:hypothetical protein H2203_000836 [Dothideales sp. JES 119]
MADDHDDHHGPSGWAIFIIVLVVLALIAAVGWIIFTQYRARRLGLPAPSLNPFARSSRANNSTYTAPAPAPGGIQGWFTSKIDRFRNGRTAGGAYESTGYGGGGGRGRDRRGFGPLDPDEAWDTRVGNEADYGGYYEEQELGLQDPATGPYGGEGTVERELDHRYDEEMGGGARGNPFGDEAERSDMNLRGMSPRPMVDTASAGAGARGHRQQQSLGAVSNDDSPTERRSMFRENM